MASQLLLSLRMYMALLTAGQGSMPTTAPAGKTQRPFQSVRCDGMYPRHLQGVCTNGRDAIFWSFTDVLVRTDLAGRMVRRVEVANHHGDLCYDRGRLYVAVNLGEFNKPAGRADSWVYVYDADSLAELARHRVAEVVHGAGGIAYHDGRFVVVGGLPEGVQENYLYEYDESFAFRKRHVLASDYTLMGIQTAAFIGGHWWFGCYGKPPLLLKADRSLALVGKYEFDCALGITGLPDGRAFVGRGRCLAERGCTGWVQIAVADDRHGYRLVAPATSSQPHQPAQESADDDVHPAPPQ